MAPPDERHEAEARATALLAMNQRLMARLIAWGARRYGEGWDPDGPWKAIAVAQDGALFQAITAYHYRAEWTPTVGAFLADAEAAAELTGPERDVLVAQSQVWLSYWLIEAVVADGRMALRDLLTGELRAVTAPSRPASWFPDRVLLARVLDHDGLSVVAGAHSTTLTRDEAAEGREFAYNMLRCQPRRLSVARLRRPDAAMVLVGCWASVLAERRRVSARPARPTHDAAGRLLIHVEDRLLFAPELCGEVTRLLDALPGRPCRFRPGLRLVARGEVPIDIHGLNRLGEYRVGADGRLTLESYTLEEADQLRAMAERACPGLLRFQVRILTDPEVLYEQLRAANFAAARAAPAPPPPTPDEVARWARMYAYERWVDQPCDALHGLTPREVSIKRGPRTELRQLLDDMERVEAAQPPARRCDLGLLRRDLLGRD